MDKLFAVTSGKGGVGKSTLSAGVAAALANMGSSVLLIDLDEGLRCLDLMLGVSENIVFDLADVLGGANAQSAIYPVPDCKGLYLMPAPARHGEIDPELFGAFLREALLNFDKVVVDFPAGIDFTLYKALPDYTVFLTVCTGEPVSLRDAALVGEKLAEEGKNNVRLVINRFDVAYIKDGIYSSIDDMIDRAGIRLVGIVPFDISLSLSFAASKLPKKGNAKKAFDRIAKRLCGQDVKLPRPHKI